MPQTVPKLAGIFAFTAIASLGLPGLAGFWGEVMALLSSYSPAPFLDESLFRCLWCSAGSAPSSPPATSCGPCNG